MCEIDKNIPIGKQLFVGGWATAFMRPENLYAHAVIEGLIDPEKISEKEFTSRDNLKRYHNDGPFMNWSYDPEELEERLPGEIGVACLARNSLFRDHADATQNEDLEAYHERVNKALEHLDNNPFGLVRIRGRETTGNTHLY